LKSEKYIAIRWSTLHEGKMLKNTRLGCGETKERGNAGMAIKNKDHQESLKKRKGGERP